MRHVFLLLALTPLLGCRSSPPPITDGMMMTWTYSVEGQDDGLIRAEFRKVDRGWRLTTQAGSVGSLDPPTQRLLDERLREDGEAFRVFLFPMWLPPSKRSEGSGFGEIRVRDAMDWEAWRAWHTTLGPAHGYYDVDTGFLVGLSVPRLGGLRARLTETNVPGLSVSGVP
jgi:hypothetical protein